MQRARYEARQGKSASTQAGGFVRDEIRKIRRGEHGARSPEQAIAIGLNEARRAGVALPPPPKGKVSERSRRSAEKAYEVATGRRKPTPRPKAARAAKQALKREPTSTVSKKALSRHATKAAARRSKRERSASAMRAVRTKGPLRRRAAAKKANRTRARGR
jgi:hypothetical protein